MTAPTGQLSAADQAATGAAIGKVLRAGVLLSSALMVAGFVWGLATGSMDGGEVALDRQLAGELPFPSSLGDLWSVRGEPIGLMTFGLLVLVATPILRVVAAGLAYFRMGDRVYASIAAAVMALLAVSFVVELVG